jgi:hypothetical protein
MFSEVAILLGAILVVVIVVNAIVVIMIPDSVLDSRYAIKPSDGKDAVLAV